MKNIAFLFLAFIAITIAGCKKSYPGDTYDFSNSLPSYVEFAAPKDAISITQDTTISVAVQMRTAVTEDVTVNYALTGTSATIAGSVVIPRNKLKTSIAIVIPDGIVPAGTVVEAELKLISAQKGSDALRIGFNDPSTEVIAITINP